MARRRGQQPLVVRIAAHDSVQHYDVGRLDLVRFAGDVEEPAYHSVTETGSREQAARLALVAARDLQVRGQLGAAPEQLEVHLSDAATDLQDRRSLEAVGTQEVDDPPARPIKATPAATPRHPAREAITEGLLTRATGVCH